VSGTGDFITYGREIAGVQLEMLATREAAIAQSATADGLAAAASAEADAARQELRGLRDELESVSEELAHVRRDLHGSWGIIEGMRRSASWRATAPLRRVKSILKER
jgi:hypothetical protein